MAAITWTDATDWDAALSTVPLNAQTLILNHVNTTGVNPAIFDGEEGPTTKLARVLLACHFGSGAGAGASGPAGGSVSSESAGGLSRSYSVPSMSSSGAHGSTEYGRQFDELVQNSLGRIGFVL